jgi:glycosyltransferase involved in cell wall biosynthesis
LTRARTRVLLLTADYAPNAWSGIGVAVKGLAESLAALGVEVHVAIAGRRTSNDDGQDRHGMRGPYEHSLDGARFPVEPIGFDWIHVHSLRLAELALELSRRYRIRLACTVHGWPHRENEGSPVAAAWSGLQQRLLSRADRIVFLSEAERALGVGLVPSVASRCHVVPNGVASPPLRSTDKRDADRSDSDRRCGPVVFAGRFAASKGVALVVDMVPEVLARRNVQFVLAGGHGDETATKGVASLTRRFEGTCSSPGWLDQERLQTLFATATLVLVPSCYEPFGLVALEAMRMGAPVLASDVGGLRDIVPANGRLASRDPRVWADAVLAHRDGARDDYPDPTEIARRFSRETTAQRMLTEVYAA